MKIRRMHLTYVIISQFTIVFLFFATQHIDHRSGFHRSWFVGPYIAVPNSSCCNLEKNLSSLIYRRPEVP